MEGNKLMPDSLGGGKSPPPLQAPAAFSASPLSGALPRNAPRITRLSKVCAILALICLASCAQINGKLKLAQGNYHYSRGMYVDAISSYMDALDYADEAAYAEYGLGVSYLALEQSEAALQRFQNAEEKALNEDKRELLYRIRYNSGVVRFKSGDVSGAANDFKRALQTDGSRLPAKLNLELSMLSLLRQNETAQIRTTEQGSVSEDNQRRKREILFNYVRQKETDKWKSWEWAGDTAETGPDY